MSKIPDEKIREVVKSKGGTLLKISREDKRLRLKILCGDCGQEWNTRYDSIQKGSWCSYCGWNIKNESDRKEEVEALGFQFISADGENIKLICGCGEKRQTDIVTLRKHPHCKWCRDNSNRGKLIYSYDYIKKTIKNLGGILLTKKEEYINSIIPVKIQCNKCGWIWDVPFGRINPENKHHNWCPECAKHKEKIGKRKYNYDYVKKYIKNNGYKLISTNYKIARDRIIIKCPEGHKFETIFQRLLADKWCPKCAVIKRGKGQRKYDFKYVKNFIESKNGILISKSYETTKELLCIKCNECQNIWEATFDNLHKNTRPTWCPKCFSGKTQKFIFNIMEDLFGSSVFYNYRGFEWLKNKRKQEIDIWVAEIKLAIEYDGEQHFRPIVWNEISKRNIKAELEKIKKRDKNKDKLIKAHPEDIKYFIRFNYKEKITKKYIIEKLKKYGVLKEDYDE
jgi:glutaredoxin-related protein